ncbi:MAG: cell division protein CrgA [Nitriliruptorales bacterium]|nr:cell division protein CrgA [Nitriliruptorales bacterium]
MPKSKHRRKGKHRPRPRQVEPQKVNPPPSAPWVGPTGAGSLVVGVLVIIVGYLEPVTDFTGSWPWLGPNWLLVVGFLVITFGFLLLTRWR